MINGNNKAQLDSISPENPFPTGRIDMRLEEIYILIMKASSSSMSPKKIIELSEKIERMSKEMKEIVNDWKESV